MTTLLLSMESRIAETWPAFERWQVGLTALLIFGILLANRVLLRRRSRKQNTKILESKKSSFYDRDDDLKSLDFSNVQPYKLDFSLSAEEPIQWWKDGYISDRVYAATMALRNIEFDEWVVMDKNFKKRMQMKKDVIEKVGKDAIDCREEGYEGCVELLELLVEYLPRRFPNIFTLSENGTVITNRVTDESYDVSKPYKQHHPLYIAGRLVEDDLNILTPGSDGEYRLTAVLSAFPAGFQIQEKMDKPLSEIHKTVPTYKERLQKAMTKYFAQVGPSKLVMRVNWSINDHEELFLTTGAHLYEDEVGTVDETIDINEVQLRVERQVLRRLPRSGAMCMLTKTYLYQLSVIAQEPGFAARLGGLLHKLPEKFAFYKRKPVWGKVVLGFLDEMALKHPPIA